MFVLNASVIKLNKKIPMPYYYFNRCPKDCLPKIEELANELSLKEVQCRPPLRE
jgi:hypothetical protein